MSRLPRQAARATQFEKEDVLKNYRGLHAEKRRLEAGLDELQLTRQRLTKVHLFVLSFGRGFVPLPPPPSHSISNGMHFLPPPLRPPSLFPEGIHALQRPHMRCSVVSRSNRSFRISVVWLFSACLIAHSSRLPCFCMFSSCVFCVAVYLFFCSQSLAERDMEVSKLRASCTALEMELQRKSMDVGATQRQVMISAREDSFTAGIISNQIVK